MTCLNDVELSEVFELEGTVSRLENIKGDLESIQSQFDLREKTFLEESGEFARGMNTLGSQAAGVQFIGLP